MPREYIYKADEDYDIIEKIDDNISVEKIRDENWMYFDNRSYWAIKKGEDVYYSNDDTFYTDKLNSTHIVIFLKLITTKNKNNARIRNDKRTCKTSQDGWIR